MKDIYVLGSINYDMVVSTNRIPVSGETTNGTGFMGNGGGKGANQAVAVSKLGGRGHLIGCVGSDAFGEICLDTLKKYGADTTFVDKADCNTGVAVIIIHDGDNRIILDHGANYALDADKVEAILGENLKEGDVFVTQMEVSAECVERSLRQAKSCGALTVFNPAPACGVTSEMLSYTDIVIPNESEAESITGIRYSDIGSLNDIRAWFNARGVRHVIVTLGDKGCYFDGEIIATKKVRAVDTTAAGDTFVGALAVMLSQGKAIEESIDFCQRASAVTIMRKGAQVSIPYLEELD